MKKSVLVFLITMLGIGVNAQESEEKGVEKLILKFAKAADNNNVSDLDSCLDEHYRIVMNQLFGSEALSVISKADYLAKIESKEWGGDKRKLEFHNITVNGSTAVAHVSLKGEKVTFISIFTLIKNKDGEWKLVSDTPIIG